MEFSRITKLLAVLRFLVIYLMIKRSNCLNFKFRNNQLVGKGSIKMGKYNKFYPGSIINAGCNSQTTNIVLGNRNVIDVYAILLSHGGQIVIGNNNFIGPRVQIQGKGGVEIGNDCLIAGNTFISASNHDISEPVKQSYRKEIGKPVKIGDEVWIGANCVITAGVTIGKGAVIGAGSIVLKDVESYTLVAGNPGKPIKKFDLVQNVWLKI